MTNNNDKKIFGDFQTPISLSKKMCDVLKQLGVKPKYIIEPTCGKGNILLTSMKSFQSIKLGYGIEINNDYVKEIKKSNTYLQNKGKIKIFNEDFFKFDITCLKLEKNIFSPNDLLVIGNPPWITNSELGFLNSKNLPKKYNINNHRGIEAITGKSNFDISESILLNFIKKYKHIKYSLAMLCKTSVARKLLIYCWKNNLPVKDEKIFYIDSTKYFNANVDSCLLFFKNGELDSDNKICKIYKDLDLNTYKNTMGYKDEHLVSNLSLYSKTSTIKGKSSYVWRNGLKHDASKIMEFSKRDNHYINGYNEIVNIEEDLLYPLLKSSDIANGRIDAPSKYVLVTQHFIGQDTSYIKYKFPYIWNYLEKYQNNLNNRKSSIYKNKPKYSIFSVGNYTFSNYKIAISSLYKKICFKLIYTYKNKPYILDDTCNYISLTNEKEAKLIFYLITSEITTNFIESIVFWDSKRAITTELLNKIDFEKIAQKLNIYEHYLDITEKNNIFQHKKKAQLYFFENANSPHLTNPQS